MEKREKNKQSLVLTRIKTLSVTVSLIILCSLFIKLCLHGFIYGFSWLVLPALFLGYLLADFITGTIHWFCDSFFDEETRLSELSEKGDFLEKLDNHIDWGTISQTGRTGN